MSVNPTSLSDTVLLDLLVNRLTLHTPDGSPWTVDEMNHTGGKVGGISLVERWPIVGMNHLYGVNPNEVLWVWRVMWKSHEGRGPGWKRPQYVRLAYGLAVGQENAQAEGRREAKRLAKQRREKAEAEAA